MIKNPGHSMECKESVWFFYQQVKKKKQLETPRKIKRCMRISWFKYKVN